MIDLLATFSIGGALGYIVREVIGDKLARDRALESITIVEFNKAASTFRAAFVDEIHLLRENMRHGGQSIDKIITDKVFVAHEKAKILFEPFMSKCLVAFETAWDNYNNCHDNYYSELIRDETGTRAKSPYNPCNTDQRKEISEIYLKYINGLLGFAKPKVNT